VDTAAVTAELGGPVAAVPLVEVADAGTAGITWAVPEIEAGAAGIALLLAGLIVSAATARLRPESLSRFKRRSSARISLALW